MFHKNMPKKTQKNTKKTTAPKKKTTAKTAVTKVKKAQPTKKKVEQIRLNPEILAAPKPKKKYYVPKAEQERRDRNKQIGNHYAPFVFFLSTIGALIVIGFSVRVIRGENVKQAMNTLGISDYFTMRQPTTGTMETTGNMVASGTASATGTTLTGLDQTSGEKSEQTTGTMATGVQSINDIENTIREFYNAMNVGNEEKVTNGFAAGTRNSSVVKTYFSQPNISDFIDLTVQGVNVSAVEVSSGSSADTIKATYTLTYDLEKTGETRKEERTAVFVLREDGYKIAEMTCDTRWCSRGPFFNVAKFQ